jgi:hypothetical protein
MFGLSKREIRMYENRIMDLEHQVANLQTLVESERKRAEAAINALLIRVAKIAITPNAVSEKDQEALKEKQFDLFGDGAEYTEEKALEDLQS